MNRGKERPKERPPEKKPVPERKVREVPKPSKVVPPIIPDDEPPKKK